MSRAVSSALGVLLVTALTLVLAAVAGVAVIATVPPTTVSSADLPEPVVLSASADVDPDDGTVRVTIVHESGSRLDVREIVIRLSAGGTRLEHQPSVPFYSAPGFGSFPSGPFNPAADPRWERGERASLVLTGANADPVQPGTTVRIELYRDDFPIAAVETTAR